jgi:hypothetical protein
MAIKPKPKRLRVSQETVSVAATRTASREFVKKKVVLEYWQHETGVAAGDFDVRDDRDHDFRKSKRRNRKIMSLQSKHR